MYTALFWISNGIMMKHYNKMKKFIILLMGLCLLFGQQGEYVRKSISSLESIWFKPGYLSGLEFDSKIFEKFIDFYVEVDRFDYNVLPQKYLQEFQ